MPKIQKLFFSEKGNLIADIGKGFYIGRLNSMELAICRKTKEGFLMHKQVVAGIMMRTDKDFRDAIHMLNDNDLNIQPATA